MLAVGQQIPGARVWKTPYESASLLELAADGPILLLFYLFDWSSTCTNELELVSARGDDFREAGVQPYGISRDSAWTHVAWQQALDIDLPLLSDWNGDATRGFGVAQDYRGMLDVPERTAFLVGPDGRVLQAWHYGASDVPDVDELVDAARALARSAA